MNRGGYSLSVIDTSTMTIVSQINAVGRFFIGLQITGNGPYTVWASGGADSDVKLFTISTTGTIAAATPSHIVIPPSLPANAGWVSNYKPAAVLNTANASGDKPAAPTGFDRANGAAITFPAGSALSKDGKYLYVACNGDNSLAVIDTASLAILKQVPVGYFPYDVAVRDDNAQVFVTNWGVTAYKFAKPTYDASGLLTAIDPASPNEPAGYFVPQTDTAGTAPRTSSVSIIDTPGGSGANASLQKSLYEGMKLDSLSQIGDTHPSAAALVANKFERVLYVARANDDSLSLIDLTVTPWRRAPGAALPEKTFDLSLLPVSGAQPAVHGAYPNALVASPDGSRLYVAEAAINSVAILDTTSPMAPRLLGRIPTGWYPAALTLSADGRTLYIVNAKGIGEDAVGAAPPSSSAAPGLTTIDSNFIFGSVQKVDVGSATFDAAAVAANNYSIATNLDTSVVPTGGQPSDRIKHVFFILHENKTFDSMLGTDPQFGPYASSAFVRADGTTFTDPQFAPVALNTGLLAHTFATAVNYYSDAEESDAGHQFSASGTATDYTEKTLLVKGGRGVLVNKNFEPEDYPEAGYIFNNAARHSVSFKDYGALIRIAGTDTGTSTPPLMNDTSSGKTGYPTAAHPLVNAGDVDSPTHGLGQSYFLNLPILAILGTTNSSGEARLDHDYPGYNFNISDQRRALEFIKDFDRMVAAGTLPTFIYIYQPSDHTGGAQAKNVTAPTSAQQVNDGDVGLGMVVSHIMSSPAYYDASKNQGSAIFVTYDDAQSTLDHIHPHRTPLIVVSPFAKPAYLGRKHYSTASIVKTEELLLGLPPSNLGDLLATDLRDLFQPAYNGITAGSLSFTRAATYKPSAEGRKVWSLVKRLDTEAPDRDSHRLGALSRLSLAADRLHEKAATTHQLGSHDYRAAQKAIYAAALKVVSAPVPRDLDD